MNTPRSQESSLRKLLMWYKVTNLFEKEHLSKSQIHKITGLDRKTIRKYLGMSENEFISSASYERTYGHKLDKYENFIVCKLESCPSRSASQIEDLLKEQYGDSLEQVCSKTIYNYVEMLRHKHNLPKKDDEPRPYNMLPELPFGEFAQVDFGEKWMKNKNGGRAKVYFFAMVMSRSRMKYLYFSEVPFTTSLTIYAHELAFQYFGGKPKNILYDQDKVLLSDENLGDLILTREFSSFASQQHFRPVFCRKSDPESKGKIENVVGYTKDNFLLGREYINIETLNVEALAWLKRTGNGSMHHGIFRIPAEVFEEEKAYLSPYYGTPVPPKVEMKEYYVRKDNTISYHCSFYSVPSGTYKGRGTTVKVEELDGKLNIYSIDTGKTIAQHNISTQKGGRISDPSHMTQRGKGTEELESEIRGYLGDTEALELYLTNLCTDKGRYYRSNLSYIIKHMESISTSTLSEALVKCMANNAYNGAYLIETAHTMMQLNGEKTTAATPAESLSLQMPETAHMQPEKRNISSTYSIFFNGK